MASELGCYLNNLEVDVGHFLEKETVVSLDTKKRINQEVKMASGLELLGDIEYGRPTYGKMVPVALFRALRLVGVMEGMEAIAGRGANSLIYNGGKNLGKSIGESVVKQTGKDLNKYVAEVVKVCKDLGIGGLTIVEADLERGHLQLQVTECVTCSGIPNIGKVVCHFEGGLISGILEKFTDTRNNVIELECWGKGDKRCLFEATISSNRA